MSVLSLTLAANRSAHNWAVIRMLRWLAHQVAERVAGPK